MAGNPQAGMAYPPVWIAWWLRAPSALGWLTVAHLLWGGLGAYRPAPIDGTGRWAATVAAGVYQASPLSPGPHRSRAITRTSGRPAGIPGRSGPIASIATGRARGLLLVPILALTYLTGHPQEWLLLVMALSGWAVVDGLRAWRSSGPRRSAGRVAGLAGVPGAVVGMAGVDVIPQCLRPALAAPQPRPRPRGRHPAPLSPGRLNAFQLLSPTALGGPADYFGDDNYWETVFSIGLVPLVLAMIAAIRHPDRRLVRGWLVLAALAVAFACGRALGLYSLCYAIVPGFELMPRAGALVVPRQPGRCGAGRAGRADASGADGGPRRLATARLAARRGRSSSRSVPAAGRSERRSVATDARTCPGEVA